MAIIAVALQLVLAFGHVHGEALSHASEVATLAADGSLSGQHKNPALPTDEDYCSICAALSLLAGAQTAHAPPLPLPTAILAASPAIEPETIRATAADPSFRSRAPPLS